MRGDLDREQLSGRIKNYKKNPTHECDKDSIHFEGRGSAVRRGERTFTIPDGDRAIVFSQLPWLSCRVPGIQPDLGGKTEIHWITEIALSLALSSDTFLFCSWT